MNWLLNNLDVVGDHLLSHLLLALPPIVASFLLAIPLGWLANRVGWLRTPLLTGAGLTYAIPSLPLFIVLPIILGTSARDPLNIVVALTLYGLALMVPVAAADALRQVDPAALDAADAMGYRPLRRFLAVDLPLAGPTLLAGLRVVAVSTVSLVTVGAVLGIPSLGLLFTDGFQRGIIAEVLTGIVATVALALVLDGRPGAGWTPAAALDAPRPRRVEAVHAAHGEVRMNYLVDALAWIADPARWPGPNGIATRLGEHLAYSVVGVLIACAIGDPGRLVGGPHRRGARPRRRPVRRRPRPAHPRAGHPAGDPVRNRAGRPDGRVRRARAALGAGRGLRGRRVGRPASRRRRARVRHDRGAGADPRRDPARAAAAGGRRPVGVPAGDRHRHAGRLRRGGRAGPVPVPRAQHPGLRPDAGRLPARRRARPRRATWPSPPLQRLASPAGVRWLSSID